MRNHLIFSSNSHGILIDFSPYRGYTMFRDKAKGVINKRKTKSKSFKISIAIDYRYGIINI